MMMMNRLSLHVVGQFKLSPIFIHNKFQFQYIEGHKRIKGHQVLLKLKRNPFGVLWAGGGSHPFQ